MSTEDPLFGAEIPVPYADRSIAISLFRSTQCSWCRKFYTTPFICPFEYPQSNCNLFVLLKDDERAKLLSDTKWTSIMEDQMRHLQKGGVIARCRKCKTLNPNPKSNTCWKCGESLSCPSCNVGSVLIYDIGKNVWKCPNNSCGKTFGPIEETKTVSVADILKKVVWNSLKQPEKEQQTVNPKNIQKSPRVNEARNPQEGSSSDWQETNVKETEVGCQ